MEYKLSNNHLTLSVKGQGAEVVSLLTRCGSQLIWTADPAYWNRHSPLLFPCVGGNWNGMIQVGGRSFSLPKHGFVQDAAFEIAGKTSESSVTFQYSENEDTLKMYPFPFRLSVCYTLCDHTIGVKWRIENHGDTPMPFMIGGHPAFLLPQFEENETVHAYLRFPEVDELLSTPTLPNGFAHTDKTERFPLTDHLLPLTNTTFLCDTILDTTGRIHEVQLLDKHKKNILVVKFQSPVLALWAPCGGASPFVCVEPWFGCCDNEGYNGEFSDRQHVQNAPAKGLWTGGYEITISEDV
ncbi:MAG: aldose 1-epimerase family protein [Bacteroidaceae bacterium]|nr:aldose 1-epimerase family protein [Bacteroidaceae bacterium]